MTEPGNGGNESDDGLAAAVRRKGSFLQTLKAVAWSFLGIRRGRDYDRDVQNLNPVHVIIAGIIGALLFIALLLVAVNWVASGGVASS